MKAALESMPAVFVRRATPDFGGDLRVLTLGEKAAGLPANGAGSPSLPKSHSLAEKLAAKIRNAGGRPFVRFSTSNSNRPNTRAGAAPKLQPRRYCSPQEILDDLQQCTAPAYVFLASPHCSSYITSEILPIIGGYSGG